MVVLLAASVFALLWVGLVPSGRQVLRACLRFDVAQVTLAAGLRVGSGMFLALYLSRDWGYAAIGLPMSLGILLTGLADFAEPYGERVRVMSRTALYTTVALLLGGLVASSPGLHVVVALVVAMIVGYAGAVGPRSALVSLFCLALFSLYSGTPTDVGTVLRDAAFYLAGGAFSVLVASLAAPPARFYPTRRKVAAAFLQLGVVCEDIAAVLRDGRVLVAVDAAVQSKRQSGASGATASWIEGFIGDVQSARLVVAMMLSVWRQEPADRGAITRVLEAARTLARGVAGRLAGWPSRSSLAAALAELEAAGCACEAPAVRTLAASLHASFAATVARLDEPWPIGRRASPVERPPSGAGVVASLRQHLRWGDIQVRHALKLGLTYTVATVLALGPLNVMLDRHGFWIPLTVAWVCRPDVAGSVTRFSLRLCGTVFGVLLGATLLQVITDPVGRMLVTALGACGMAAFLFANYALAVGGVTVLVLSLAGVMGGYTQELAEARLIATLLGCGLVGLSAYVVAVRSGTAVPMHLQRMSSHLRQLMASVRAEAVGAIRNPIRAAMRRDRLAAAAALAAADAEPRAPWEGRAVGMELKALRAVLEQLDGWAERIAYIDLVERGQVSEEEWQALGGALDALDRDLLKSVQA